MPSFDKQISDSAAQLQGIVTAIRTGRPKLPSGCLEKWESRALLHQQLLGTSQMFPARDSAWKLLQSIAVAPLKRTDGGRDFIDVGTVEMEFAVARHLALASYITVCWSIYDRISNVCGRISGVPALAEHKSNNPKIIDFFTKDNQVGFAIQMHLRESYRWPLMACYKIRNWLVHDGYDDGGRQMFEGHRHSDSFLLHANAKSYVEAEGGYAVDGGQIQCCCVETKSDPWNKNQLLRILECYHSEIDKMFTSLLRWSVESLVIQVKAFSDR